MKKAVNEKPELIVKKKNKIKRSIGEMIFDSFNIFLMILIGFVTLYPFWYVLVAAMADPTDVITGKVMMWFGPGGINLSAYQKVLGLKSIWIAYANTIFYAIVGTAASLVVTVFTAYPLAKKRMHGRVIVTLIMLISMWFKAGMMPRFLNFKALGLLDNRWGIIIGFVVTPFYVILMRSYFQNGIPDSLEESARIDGASDWIILFKIFMPLSVPALMTIGLYYFVGRWNSYFWAMILIRDPNKIPLQVILRKLIVETTMTQETDVDYQTDYNEQTIIYSTIVVAVVPMLTLYPFIQKFFVKGIMIGAVKG